MFDKKDLERSTLNDKELDGRILKVRYVEENSVGILAGQDIDTGIVYILRVINMRSGSDGL